MCLFGVVVSEVNKTWPAWDKQHTVIKASVFVDCTGHCYINAPAPPPPPPPGPPRPLPASKTRVSRDTSAARVFVF